MEVWSSQINTYRKVPLQVNFFDDDIFLAFYESSLSTLLTMVPELIDVVLNIKYETTYSTCM
jgi:hypothetical protein